MIGYLQKQELLNYDKIMIVKKNAIKKGFLVHKMTLKGSF